MLAIILDFGNLSLDDSKYALSMILSFNDTRTKGLPTVVHPTDAIFEIQRYIGRGVRSLSHEREGRLCLTAMMIAEKCRDRFRELLPCKNALSGTLHSDSAGGSSCRRTHRISPLDRTLELVLTTPSKVETCCFYRSVGETS
jgi:hypothetical protein